MSTNINLKELWKHQEMKTPDTKQLFEKADGFKKRNLKTIVFVNIQLVLVSSFIVFIWYYYQPEMISTKIGIVLTILSMLLYLMVYNQFIPLLLKIEHDLTSSEYLQQLLKFKEKQRFLQSTMLNIYFILLSTGIGLYMFEYTHRMKLIWAAVAYGITFLWVVINWFYFRPRAIKKQRAKVDELIKKFEELDKQLSANE
jgi:hypothetical protein